MYEEFNDKQTTRANELARQSGYVVCKPKLSQAKVKEFENPSDITGILVKKIIEDRKARNVKIGSINVVYNGDMVKVYDYTLCDTSVQELVALNNELLAENAKLKDQNAEYDVLLNEKMPVVTEPTNPPSTPTQAPTQSEGPVTGEMNAKPKTEHPA